MMTRSSLYVLVVILVIAMAVIARSLAFLNVNLKVLPIIVAGFIVILSAIELMRELKESRKSKKALKPEPKEAGSEAGKELLGYVGNFGWLVAFFGLILLVGFLAGVSLFILIYLKSHRRAWPISIGTAAGMTLFIYVIFERVLEADLFRGLLFGGHFM